MPQSLVLGNGSLLVNFNDRALVRDFYFPYAGLENHSSKKIHQLGVWVNGRFAWLTDRSWQIEQRYEEGTMVGASSALNEELGLKLELTDIVYNEKPIFVRKVVLTNKAREQRLVRSFFHQDFKISDSEPADTAYFDPGLHVIVHYKGQRCFLVNAMISRRPFQQYSIGMNDPTRGLKGTWMDAEDGLLSGSAIEHGPVDSVLGLEADIPAGGKVTLYYWIAAGSSIAEAKQLDQYVRQKSATHIIETTRGYWRAWAAQHSFGFHDMPAEIVRQFNHSLLVIRTQVDNHGSILAANDSDMLKYGKDSYSYAWPRDGALTALALDKAGYSDLTRRFYEFCRKTLTAEGYQLHKYSPDGSFASSWHPWVGQSGEAQLPIQEDETATVLYTLRQHWQYHKDLEFIEELYNPLIKRSAHFLMKYRDREGLPLPSYDLWEETRGVFTYTLASVFGGLMAASDFAQILGKASEARKFKRAAEQVKMHLLEKCWDQERDFFIKGLIPGESGAYQPEPRLDSSSIYGVIKYGVLPIDDARVGAAIQATQERLSTHTKHGGLVRYEGDGYHRPGGQHVSNPWIITTLWQTQYQIMAAQSEEDLAGVVESLNWVKSCSSSAGIIPEQLNPYTGQALSVAPLTWSHAVFVETIIDYLYKLEELGICKACVAPNR